MSIAAMISEHPDVVASGNYNDCLLYTSSEPTRP